MSIPPIGPLGASVPSAPAAAAATRPAAGASFAEGLEAVSRLQSQADQMGVAVATGQGGDIHDFMAATTKASLAVELTVALRNRAVEAYQEIMRMQV